MSVFSETWFCNNSNSSPLSRERRSPTKAMGDYLPCLSITISESYEGMNDLLTLNPLASSLCEPSLFCHAVRIFFLKSMEYAAAISIYFFYYLSTLRLLWYI
jgi:hypothetical protein